MRMSPMLAACMAISAGHALAQSTATPSHAANAVTHLHLTAQATLSVTPDLLVADLSAQETNPKPAEAQQNLNAAVARAMAESRAYGGVDPRAMGYDVSQVDLDADLPASRTHPHRMAWRAQQTIELRSQDGERLLTLVGRLQDEGLTIASLQWQLSPGLEQRARDDAMVQALLALRSRAGRAAQALGLTILSLQDVRIDMPEPPDLPVRPMMMARMAVRAAPEATAAPLDIASTVTADVILTP